ncbi:hypothetical protein GCK32_001522 [Trichostrongylus colubriformis]|uniref:Uncharacterized protein n=1 Tax=Trichostrongylus colubriformis TaxID=6319 RepID=A0AAN8ILR8_TRICO
MFDSIYRMMVDGGRISAKRRAEWFDDEEHDTKAMAAKVQEYLTRLDRNISDIEYELGQSEKRVLDEKVENKQQFISVFNKTIEKVENKLENLGSRFQTSEKGSLREYSAAMKEVGPSTSKIRAISDQEYLERLIEETREEQETESAACEENELKSNDDESEQAVRRNDQAERVQAEREQAERVQAEREQAERVQAERVQAERVQAERVQAERVQAEQSQANRMQAERDQYVANLRQEVEDLYDARSYLPDRRWWRSHAIC